jgi:hypothetical protein
MKHPLLGARLVNRFGKIYTTCAPLYSMYNTMIARGGVQQLSDLQERLSYCRSRLVGRNSAAEFPVGTSTGVYTNQAHSVPCSMAHDMIAENLWLDHLGTIAADVDSQRTS